MSYLRIESLKNPRVKATLALGKSRERHERQVFAVEGAREIERAWRCDYEAVELFVCQSLLSPMAQQVLAAIQAKAASRVQCYEVTEPVFAKLAVREASDGILAVFRQKLRELAGLKLPSVPLLLAVEGVEKPGNLGALLRSADGAGVHAVIVLDQAVDVYNPHVVRTSLGTVFHVPVVAASTQAFHAFARKHSLTIIAAALTEQTRPYDEIDYRHPCTILLGSEATGLSPYWLSAADKLVKIPMLGVADSLNVATAGAVLLYEARRQLSKANW